MKKVAVLTLYGEKNFGNKLQNYAVQELIKEKGYECKTISNVRHYRLRGLKSKLIAFLGFPQKTAEKKRFILQIEACFKKFSEKKLQLGETIKFRDTYRIADNYDFFVAGSDQVWHNWSGTNEEMDYFFIRFAPPHKRICISPSFGFESIPEEFRQQYTDGLNGFKHLSCREESGCKLINELTGREAQLLCDPTMALTSDEWDNISSGPSFDVPEKYILTYFLGDAPAEAINYAKKLSEKEGLPIINLYDWNYPEYLNVQPDEFLYLVKRAEHFCTTSFHGCVFSIIYHTPFTVFERNDLKGIHGRISTLLKKFGLEHRDAADQRLDIACDFSKVDDILSSERKKMRDYLNTAFADAEAGELNS